MKSDSETYDRKILLADYAQTMNVFNMLAEIRFKLVALLPTLAGIAFVFIDEGSAERRAAIGLLGLVSTLGVLIYEVRNTSLYDSAVQRAKRLEGLLRLPPLVGERAAGGVMRERPASKYQKILIIPWLGRSKYPAAKHDQGLAFLYSATMGIWGFLASAGLAGLIADPDTDTPNVVGATFGSILFAITLLQLLLIDRQRAEMDVPESEPEEEVRKVDFDAGHYWPPSKRKKKGVD